MLYYTPPAIALVFKDLDVGYAPITVMNRYHFAIVSHGTPSLEDIQSFQEQLVTGLGYPHQA